MVACGTVQSTCSWTLMLESKIKTTVLYRMYYLLFLKENTFTYHWGSSGQCFTCALWSLWKYLSITFTFLLRISDNALSLSFVATQWTDMILQDHSYTDVDHLSLSKEKSTQTNTKSFEENGMKCNTFHVFMSYDNIATASKSLLY